VTLGDLRQGLPDGAALVSFVQYNRHSRRSAGDRATEQTPSYAAFVLTRNGPLRMISLGSVREVERLIADWRVEVSRSAGPARGRRRSTGQGSSSGKRYGIL
jgi:hypothetical protein